MTNCGAEEECEAGRGRAGYHCWSVVNNAYCQARRHGLPGCENCLVYKRKALAPLDASLLPRQWER